LKGERRAIGEEKEGARKKGQRKKIYKGLSFKRGEKRKAGRRGGKGF